MKAPTCGGVDGTNYVTYNGSNFRAAYAPTDMALLELVTNPNITDCITYAGWNRTSVVPSNGTGIHHPRGDVKKISFDRDAVSSNSLSINWTSGLTSPPNSHWVVGFDEGTTEGGSSGSPLFNQSHQIVGQLHGGASGCAPITKYYGRFDVSWNGGGTNDTRLSNWLDPINMGIISMNTEIPAYISGPPYLCTTATYEIPSLPTGATVTWTATGSISISGANNINPVSVTKSTDGTGTLTANISTACGSFSVVRNNIQTGTPSPAYIYGTGLPAPDYCRMSTYYFHVNPVAYTTGCQWDITGYGGTIVSGQGTYTIGLKIDNTPGTAPHTFKLSARYIGECGLSATLEETIISRKCTGGIPLRVIYPNPANETLVIAYTEDERSEETGEIVKLSEALSEEKQISLFNDRGTEVKAATLKSGETKAVLDTRDLPNGRYFLHIREGEEITKQQIIIEH